MALSFPPKRGTIILCNFSGFREPEMTKIRPVIVLSPSFNERYLLSTIVCCSTTKPEVIYPYHYELNINPPLPAPYNSPVFWVKGDMVYSFSLNRLKLPLICKDKDGKRIYDNRVVSASDMEQIEKAVMYGLGVKLALHP